VIFVAAYAEHAVEAFAVDAVDCLLKPVDPDRLAESLARVERQRASRPQPAAAIELRTPRRTAFAQPGEIVILRADGDFTQVHLASQPPVMIWRTLAHFESLLPAPPPPASAKRWPPSGAADLDEHRHGWDRATSWRS
jgi:two-component system LytT family response regulator